jgi:hypothetical protein
MPIHIPVDFQELANTPPTAGPAKGYPYQLRGADLHKNFVYAALDAHSSLVEQFTGPGGFQGRKLKIPPVPGEGTHVLGAVDGALAWIATEEC